MIPRLACSDVAARERQVVLILFVVSLEERIASARADKRELAWLTGRAAAARADRERVASQLEIAERAVSYEQADVDHLTKGIAGLFHRLTSDRADLAEEERELAAAQLLRDELAEEVRAIDVELEHLATRVVAVADADARYREALAALEGAARSRGVLTAELDALAATIGELLATRRELADAIQLGVATAKALHRAVIVVRTLSPNNPDVEEPPGLWSAITGRTGDMYRDLSRTLAAITQAIASFERACAQLDGAAPDLEPRFPGLPSLGRHAIWHGARLEDVFAEASRLADRVGDAVAALRARDAAVATAVAECERVRARLLDPRDPG
jgi:hypothetical protein